MKLGKINKKFIFTILIFFKFSFLTAEEKIQSVPLINLEELSPTFEEDKDQLDQIDDKNNNVASNTVTANEEELDNNGQVFINLTALNKITAKTSFIKIAIGDKKSFGTENPFFYAEQRLWSEPDTCRYLDREEECRHVSPASSGLRSPPGSSC